MRQTLQTLRQCVRPGFRGGAGRGVIRFTSTVSKPWSSHVGLVVACTEHSTGLLALAPRGSCTWEIADPW